MLGTDISAESKGLEIEWIPEQRRRNRRNRSKRWETTSAG